MPLQAASQADISTSKKRAVREIFVAIADTN